MHAMQDGKFSAPGQRPSETPPVLRSSASQPGNASDGGAPVEWAYQRKSANKIIAYAVDPKKPDAAPSDSFGVVFQRSGFADWKLTEVRMPSLHK